MSKAPKEARRMGRPPVGEETLKKPITLRLPPRIHEEIRLIAESRADEGADMATVIRELIAAGLKARREKMGDA